MTSRLTVLDIVETTNVAVADMRPGRVALGLLVGAEPALWESEALLNANALFRWLVSRGASK